MAFLSDIFSLATAGNCRLSTTHPDKIRTISNKNPPIMVNKIETTKDNLIAVRLTGSLTKQDYDQLIPVLESKIKQFGKVDLYWEMEAIDGWNLGGLWEEIKFDVTHVNSFRKVAIVGDRKWEEWIARMIRPFTTAQINYYDVRQKDEAMAWVSQ
jgi:hypothetical protein